MYLSQLSAPTFFSVVGQSDKADKSEKKVSDEFLGWLDCQFSWWKNLDVVRVTDECYLSLCCWQVKVTGGDVKQCRKMKRKQGIGKH